MSGPRGWSLLRWDSNRHRRHLFYWDLDRDGYTFPFISRRCWFDTLSVVDRHRLPLFKNISKDFVVPRWTHIDDDLCTKKKQKSASQ